MAGTVTVPGLGKVKKTTAYMLGAAAVLVVGVAWYRTRTLGADAAAETGAAAVAGGDQVNPATGYIYGSDADVAALAGQSVIGGGGAVGYTGGGSSDFYTGGGGSGPQYSTNAQWSQAAEDYLVNTVQGDANTIGNALGKYITGQPLSPDQVNIISQAIAFTGYPPTNGPTGYPPSYRTSNEPPTTTPTTPGKPAAVSGLRATKVTANAVYLDWQPVTGVQGYHVLMDGKQWVSVVYSNYAFHGLARSKTHRFTVVPFTAAGDGPGASISVKTKAR